MRERGEKEGRGRGRGEGGGWGEGKGTISCHPKSVPRRWGYDDIPQRLAQTPCPVCRR